jgi:hypothetical protein
MADISCGAARLKEAEEISSGSVYSSSGCSTSPSTLFLFVFFLQGPAGPIFTRGLIQRRQYGRTGPDHQIGIMHQRSLGSCNVLE